MTRDTQRLHDEHDRANDTKVLAALWATAQFPRLPADAPAELQSLTIDLDDPKRIYAIHRGSRRHHFQLLVERYILQIRYGCTSKTCSTISCFSCRKRLAGGAPVRRYNATSARTLAVYLATQDNPEQGLCRNPLADRPPLVKVQATGKYRGLDVKITGNRPEVAPGQDLGDEPSKTSAAHTTIPKHTGIDEGQAKDYRATGGDGSSDTFTRPRSHILEDPIKKDHRSFIQNAFNTAAFKMLEWLTPQNLQAAAEPEKCAVETRSSKNEEIPKEVADVPANNQIRHDDNLITTTIDIDPPSNSGEERKGIVEELDAHTSKRPSSSLRAMPYNNEVNDDLPAQPAISAPTPRRKTSHVRTTSDTIEPQSPRSTNNHNTKSTDLKADTPRMITCRPSPKQKILRQALITSPSIIKSNSPPQSVEQVIPTTNTTESLPPPIVEEDASLTHDTCADERPQPLAGQDMYPPSRVQQHSTILPQSLSYLPADTIDLICDIMQGDGTSENHMLYPRNISEAQKRRQNASTTIQRAPWQSASAYPQSAKIEWQAFIEQSIFDVLRRPESLLQSFRHNDEKLFDTQTIWYLMLRMTRVAPSLVFDSLWSAVERLFKPPGMLEASCERNSGRPTQAGTILYMSDHDAAQVINICLHALVATAPLVNDSRQIMNMSRIRSYGLAMLGRDSSSLEPVGLCLQYEDAFTNDLAMRLARRLFAAITTRHKFRQLLDLQEDAHEKEAEDHDILESVLGTLSIMSSAAPSLLNFSKAERDVHETRITTLILDWARTVMLQEWTGGAEMPNDGPFGGALLTMAAIYKHRKSLLLGDIHFRTEYFSERLDQVTMPRQWLSFEPNKRTFHLLDYPYLFNPSTLVTYFRSINFSRMNHSHETAKATVGLMHTAMAMNHNLMAERQRRDTLVERLRVATSGFLVLEIRRTDVLLDTFNAIWRREERELMRPLKVRLGEDGGEEGLDSGGVQQEFFRLAIAEALDPRYGTITIDERTKMTWFQPGSPEPLWKFELIGTIVSLAIYNGLTLPVTFPKALYRKLLQEDVTELHHIADGWPDLASGLTSLLEWDESQGAVEDIFARTYEFSVEQFGQPVSREMGAATHWPQFSDLQVTNPDDAPLVTNENRNSYVSDYIRWLTDISVRPQFEAFKSGFFTCIDRRSIKLFDADTLQSVVEGVQEIDIAELRRATRYVGWEASDKPVRDFWSVVKRFDTDQKKKLLEFVTASDRVPVGGMRNLQFTLQKNGVGDGHLPTSYTCYGILLLPEYSSKDVLKEKLAMSLENAKGFGFA